MSETGKLWLIGTGPGDPELLTLKAVRLLAEADCVTYPHKPGARSRAFEIAEDHLAQKVERLPVAIPMQRERGPARAAYDRLATDLEKRVLAGQSVVYLCEGDPLFYGSAIYLLARLDDKIPVEIVPGISALNATAALTARPLAARNDVLKVLPATLEQSRLETELESADSVAIIKLGRHFDRLRSILKATGHAETALVIEDAGGPRQRITSLEEFGDQRPYFALILSYRGSENNFYQRSAT